MTARTCTRHPRMGELAISGARTLLLVAFIALPAMLGIDAATAVGQPPPPPPPGPLPPSPVPAANPITPEKAVLGKILFWEEQLSSDNTVSCGTCHRPEFGGSDPRVARIAGPDGILGNADDIFGSPGVIRSDASNNYQPDPEHGFNPQVTGRWTPTSIGAQYFSDLFWDGRGDSTFIDPETNNVSIPAGGGLESQAVGPPLSDVEMAHMDRDWDQISEKLVDVHPLQLATDWPADVATAIGDNPTYPDLFADAFGDEQITAERIAMAIATYERTLVPNQTPWDAFNSGNMNALTPNQRAGLNLFVTQGRCVICHQGALFADNDFHALGVRPPNEDLGRFEVTGDPADRGRFKTATLRNVGLRVRFMHNGGFSTLDQVVNFYNNGGGFPENRDPALRPLGLNPGQRSQIVDFLENGLTDPRVELALPPFDRPTLHSERTQPSPRLYGLGNEGAGGITPSIIARTPPAIANPDFRLGIHGGLGGATSILAISNEAAAPGSNENGVPLNISLSGNLRLIKKTLNDTGAGQGYATFKKSLPGNAGLIGKTFFAQWFVKDPAAVGGFAATPGAEIEIF